ncbi:MAG: hypothetical protein INQ03_25195 [Candidatus Heimdallarchaeota archaeon]|nr:hypothetical protein [Candidatus Heimdallarchaeota archaeon]
MGYSISYGNTLLILNTSDLSAIELITSLEIPGFEGDYIEVDLLQYQNNQLFVTGLNHFGILDVSDRLNPILLQTYEGRLHDFQIIGYNLYFNEIPKLGEMKFSHWDMSNTSSPRIISNFTFAYDPNDKYNGAYDWAVYNDILYVTEYDSGCMIFNITSKERLDNISVYNAKMKKAVVYDNQLYISAYSQKLYRYSLDDPTQPQYNSSLSVYSDYFYFHDDYLITGPHDYYLYFIHLSKTMTVTNTFDTAEYYQNIQINGDMMIINYRMHGLELVDISNINSFTSLTRYDIPSNGYLATYSYNGYLYALHENQGLHIFNSNLELIRIIDIISGTSYYSPSSVYQWDNYLIISDDDTRIYDISDPYNLVLTTTLEVGLNFMDFDIENEILYGLDYKTIIIYDLSNLASPLLLAETNIRSDIENYGITDINYYQGNIYVATNSNEFLIISVSDPTAISFVSAQNIGISSKEIERIGHILIFAEDWGSRISFINLKDNYKFTTMTVSGKIIGMNTRWDNFVYVSSQNALTVINIHDLDNPKVEITKSTENFGNHISFDNNTIYLSADHLGIFTFTLDLENPGERTIGTSDSTISNSSEETSTTTTLTTTTNSINNTTENSTTKNTPFIGLLLGFSGVVILRKRNFRI